MEATGADASACVNSIMVTTKRDGTRSPSLVLVPATHMLDNKGLKNALGGKTSFMRMDDALELTGMERDSVGPVGLPDGIPVVADPDCLVGDEFYVGGGRIGVKHVLTREELLDLVTVHAPGICVTR